MKKIIFRMLTVSVGFATLFVGACNFDFSEATDALSDYEGVYSLDIPNLGEVSFSVNSAGKVFLTPFIIPSDVEGIDTDISIETQTFEILEEIATGKVEIADGSNNTKTVVVIVLNFKNEAITYQINSQGDVKFGGNAGEFYSEAKDLAALGLAVDVIDVTTTTATEGEKENSPAVVSLGGESASKVSISQYAGTYEDQLVSINDIPITNAQITEVGKLFPDIESVKSNSKILSDPSTISSIRTIIDPNNKIPEANVKPIVPTVIIYAVVANQFGYEFSVNTDGSFSTGFAEIDKSFAKLGVRIGKLGVVGRVTKYTVPSTNGNSDIHMDITALNFSDKPVYYSTSSSSYLDGAFSLIYSKEQKTGYVKLSPLSSVSHIELGAAIDLEGVNLGLVKIESKLIKK